MAAVEKIRLSAAKCIKGYLQPPCRACEGVCPAGAFRWGMPQTELCLDCGLCTAVCPAGAIETRQSYAAKLSGALSAPQVHLACTKTVPDSMLPCLGFLTRGILWAIASKREVQLDVGACRSCVPAVYEHLCRESAAANTALEAAGRTLLRLQDTEPAAREYSRRDFFRRFRDAAKEKFGQTDAAGGAGSDGAEVHSAERMLQGDTSGADADAAAGQDEGRAGDAAETQEENPTYPSLTAFDPSAWAFLYGAFPAAVHGDLALYSGCNACGFCAHLCPQGALQADIEDADFVLSFTPQLCTACGLCTARCPKNALRLAASPAAKRWRIPLPHCANCGAPFQPIGASKLCRTCLGG